MNYFFSIRPPPLNAPHTALIKKLCRSILPLQCSLAALLSLRVTKTRRDMNKQRLRQGQRVETEARACVCVCGCSWFLHRSVHALRAAPRSEKTDVGKFPHLAGRHMKPLRRACCRTPTAGRPAPTEEPHKPLQGARQLLRRTRNQRKTKTIMPSCMRACTRTDTWLQCWKLAIDANTRRRKHAKC